MFIIKSTFSVYIYGWIFHKIFKVLEWWSWSWRVYRIEVSSVRFLNQSHGGRNSVLYTVSSRPCISAHLFDCISIAYAWINKLVWLLLDRYRLGKYLTKPDVAYTPIDLFCCRTDCGPPQGEACPRLAFGCFGGLMCKRDVRRELSFLHGETL